MPPRLWGHPRVRATHPTPVHSMLTELLSVVLPVYLCAAVGFMWVRSGRDYDTALMTDLVMFVGAPCLTFSSLTSIDLQLDRLLGMMGAVVLATGTLAVGATLVLKSLKMRLDTFLAPSVFGNSGNMGIPICYFAFGDEGLVLAVCFYAATAFMQFTTGPWIWGGRLNVAELLRTPLVWATVIALAVVASGASVPDWLGRATGLLGDFTIPIMQLTLGVSLARLKVTSFSSSLIVSGFKLGVGAAVGFGVAALLGLEGVARGVLILDCAMPVAVFNYMFASKYDRSPGDVASAVVLSTVLSFVTLPALLWAVL
jgi:predicted permease